MTGSNKITRRTILGGAAAATLAASTRLSFGKAPDKVGLTLEFRVNGANAPMILAEQGIFEKHGLDVRPEGSSGSGESIRRVASGMYQFGLADASTLVAFAAANPDVAPKIIMPIYDKFPACIISFKRNPVKSLKDLQHVKLGTGSADAGVKIFPALLKLNNIDPATIHRETFDVKLRDAMLLAGKVDAVIGFDYTSVFNLIGNGVKMEDINLLYFSDLGYSFFGNSVIASRDVIEKNPDLVRRVTAAVTEAWIYASKHKPEAIQAVVKREPLLKPQVELDRLGWVFDKLILTDNVKKNGLGAVSIPRVEHALTLIKEGFQLPVTPTVDQVYDGRFAPPEKDRKIA